MSSLLEYKFFALRKIASLKSLRVPWTIWKPIVERALKPELTGQKIFDLGEELSVLFQKIKRPVETNPHFRLAARPWNV